MFKSSEEEVNEDFVAHADEKEEHLVTPDVENPADSEGKSIF